jgi:hypothetical protein
MLIVVAGVTHCAVLLQVAAATAIVLVGHAQTVNVVMQQPAIMERRMATRQVSTLGPMVTAAFGVALLFVQLCSLHYGQTMSITLTGGL